MFLVLCAEALDVTKQSDLTGFYRGLFRETFEGPPKEKQQGSQKAKTAEKPDAGSVPAEQQASSSVPASVKPRQYRARRQSESPEPEPQREPNPDADSDVDESGSDEESAEGGKGDGAAATTTTTTAGSKNVTKSVNSNSKVR